MSPSKRIRQAPGLRPAAAPAATVAPAAPAAPAVYARAYTSREAAEVSEVPFFTIDYWGRTKFLVPTVAEGRGRGKGRQRMYSYGDLIRMRIARELREQKVSLETLRTIVQRLAPVSRELASAHFVLVGREVEIAGSRAKLMTILSRPRRRTFGVLLDLREILETVRENARQVAAVPRRVES
ncbi:MAG TPA: MerR family transcriptional regulator [Thermoanaerobaculia bacterium]